MATALYPAARPTALYTAAQQKPALTYDELVDEGQASRGLRSSLLGTSANSFASDSYKAQANGDLPRARANGLRAQQLADEAQRSAPRVQSVGDIHGVGDAADWAMGVAGQLPITLVPAMAGGLVGGGMGGALFRGAGAALGGHLGAGAAMYPQMRDAARMQQAQAEAQGAPALPAQQVLDDTSNQGLIQANIEALVPGLATRSLLGHGAKAALTKPVGGVLRRVGRDIALDSGAAGLSEGVAMNYETGRNPGRDTSGDAMRYADAMASEAMGGGVMGAAGHAGDLAHTALGTGVQATGDAAAYAARLAEQGGAAGMDKAKELWSSRPKTLDEAAVMAGEGAAKLHTGAEDAVTRVLQRGKDADVDTLLSKRTDRTESAMRADDAAKHQAATNFIAKNKGRMPTYVEAAIADYEAAPKGPFSWEPLADAVNDMHRAQGIGTAFKSFVDEASLKLGEGAAKLMNAKDDAVDTYRVKREMDKRANAQTPDMMPDIEAARDDLSPLLDEALAPLTGLKSQAALDNTLPSLTHGMRAWVENNFSMRKNGEPVVPSSLLNMFTDPAKAVQATVDLLHRQGLVDDSILPMRDLVLRQLEVKQLAREEAAVIVDEMLLPTQSHGLTAAQRRAVADDLMDRLPRDEVSTKEAKALFGPRARMALDALWAKINAARARESDSVEVGDGRERSVSGLSDDGGSMKDDAGESIVPNLGAEDLAQITSSHLDKEAGKPEVAYHHYKPGGTDKTTGEIKPPEPYQQGGRVKNKDGSFTYHNAHAAKRTSDMQTVGASEVQRQGYMDYLREKHGGNFEAIARDFEALTEAKKDELLRLQNKTGRMETMADGSKQVVHDTLDKLVNKHFYVLRETAQRKMGEATNIDAKSLGREGTKGQIIGNEWAEKSDGEYGTTKHGRIWLERVNADGSTSEFATSTSRIIRRMTDARKAEGRVDESGGIAGQRTMLHQGLASLLTAEAEGKPVLTGRVGFKETADGAVQWQPAGQDFPDSLRMHSASGQTYKDAKSAVRRGQDQELITWADDRRKKLLERTKSENISSAHWSGAMMDLQRLDQVLASKSRKALEQLRREHDYARDALRMEKDETPEVGESTVETKLVKSVSKADTFATKKLALEQSDVGDRVVKRGSGWVIEPLNEEALSYNGLPTELEGMGKTSNVRSRQEDNTSSDARNVDETTGQALHADERVKSDDAAKKTRAERTAFLVDGLAKSVPGFVASVRKISAERRDALLAHLKTLAEAGKGNPIWDGKPPADMDQFAARARVALVEMGAMKGAVKGPIPKKPAPKTVAAKAEVAKPSAPPAQKFGDVLKRMNDYLDNPPADYNARQLEAIRDWATRQEARLNEAKSKYKEGQDDEWGRLDDLRFEATMLKAKATKAIAAEAEVEAHHAEQGGPRYNAMATRLHEDLGREGFAATHDSPIKHEGKFDWRKHKGKGEGNAAFGAGTYLSTANGVHRDYKEQFTQNRNDALTQAQRDSFEAKIKKYADDPDAAELVEEYRAALVNDRKLGQGKSPTYEVSVNIKPEHMLDWNKPLSEQSEFVQKALAKEVTWRKQKAWNGNTTYELAVGNTSFGTVQDAADTMSGKFVVGTGTYGDKYDTLGEAQAAAFAKASGFTLDGANIYKGLVQRLGSQAAASDYLQSLGILGHTYDADGGKNDKYRNHVIYDDSKITTNYVHFNKQDPKHKAFGTAQAATPEEQAKFHADILRRLGPQMKSGLLEVLMGKNARGKDIYLSGKWEKGAIYASVYARNLDQIGAHEAFHEFFSRLRDEPAAADVLKVLDRAANSPYVVRQLERLLDGETEALKQIKQGAKHSAEERMAYMFQFHQAGLLKLGPETETVFQKIARFFRKVAGLINDDERADLLLRAFDRGEAQTADAAARVLANSVTARAQMYTRVNEASQPMLARASRLVNTAETNLERQGVEEYHTIRRLFKRSVGESGAQGYLDAKDHLMKQKSNELFKAFQDANGKDYAPADLALAAKYLHTGKKPTDPVVRDIVKKLTGPDGILPRMHKYLKDAGVMRWEADEAHPGKGEWVPMGKIDAKYFPRVYDTATMVTKPDEFVADLVKYNAAELNAIAAEQNALLAKSDVKDATPVTAEDVARGITNRLINAFGSELDENSSAVGFSPVMQAVNKRSLHWLAPEVLEKWGEKDVAKIMTSYVAQGIKRAEYVRRFGNGGERLQDMLKAAHDKVLDRLAEKEFGPNARGIYTTTKGEDKVDQRRVIEAALTTAGKTDVKARLDVLEIKALKVAKGAATDVMAMEGTLGYDIKPGMRRFQNSLLVYENMRLLSTSLFSQFIDPLGIVVRGGTMTDAWSSYKRGIREVIASIKGDPIKDLDAQIADQVGTTDANGFLAAFGQLYSSQYMGDKFRKANDVLFKYNGMEGFNRGMQVSATRAAINFIKRHATQPNDNSVDFLKELNLTAKDVVVDAKTGELDYTNPKIQQAIHQWVNGSIMRPNAAQRPAWGSDPHYMVFWHMKQFAYTFHDVIMKRAMYNYKTYGDMGPLGTLLMAYTPVMIATDALKGVLLSGGDEPGWMRAGLGSELQHGAMRAGLAGKFQPGVDVMGPHRTVLGLGGPAIEQIVQMFEKSPVDSAINALPGANVWNTMKGGPMVEMQGED